MKCLNKDAKKKKEQILYIRGGDNQISTGAKLHQARVLWIQHEFCGFKHEFCVLCFLMDAIN